MRSIWTQPLQRHTTRRETNVCISVYARKQYRQLRSPVLRQKADIKPQEVAPLGRFITGAANSYTLHAIIHNKLPHASGARTRLPDGRQEPQERVQTGWLHQWHAPGAQQHRWCASPRANSPTDNCFHADRLAQTENKRQPRESRCLSDDRREPQEVAQLELDRQWLFHDGRLGCVEPNVRMHGVHIDIKTNQTTCEVLRNRVRATYMQLPYCGTDKQRSLRYPRASARAAALSRRKGLAR